MSPQRQPRPTRIALVGLHGHGRSHLRSLRSPDRRHPIELVGVCDLVPPDDGLEAMIGGAPWSDDIDRILGLEPDVTILCTPIHTHVDLACRVAAAGSNLLLEKPTAPTVAGLDRIGQAIDAAGVACQVGYQALGSGAVAGIAELVAAGEIGRIIGVGGAGAAVRTPAYYRRGAWAGRRRLEGPARADGQPGPPVDVVDGVLTNPFIHAVAAGLRILGADDGDRDSDRVVATQLELHRANDIEADDTSVARLVLANGSTIVVAASVCADRQYDPHLIIHGTEGRIIWPYKGDQILLDGGRRRLQQFDRSDLLDNLIDHLADEAPLIVPLQSTRAVTDFVDRVRRAPEPHPIEAHHLVVVPVPDTEGSVDPGSAEVDLRPMLPDVGTLVRRAADALATFTELGAPWARPAAEVTTVSLGDGPTPVAEYQLAADVAPDLVPRPFLHPVRTRGGVVVSDSQPADHTWHLGVGMAIQDVGGVNLWGGRTYVRDLGYIWMDDHGSIRHLSWVQRTPRQVEHLLGWFDRGHRCLMVERRTVTMWAIGPDRWALGHRSAFQNTSGNLLELGSPGSNGRDGGGYGGFFWRLPKVDGPARTWTASAEGEDAVHGTTAPWLAWQGLHDDGPFTLVAAPADETTAADPWFVRQAGYPGFGSALAWDRPLVLEPEATTVREVRVMVLDGHHDDGAGLHRQLLGAAS